MVTDLLEILLLPMTFWAQCFSQFLLCAVDAVGRTSCDDHNCLFFLHQQVFKEWVHRKYQRFYYPCYQKLQLHERRGTEAELWSVMDLTHLITNKQLTDCEIMETGRHCCLCQSEQPLNLALHKTICKCSFLVWAPVAPKVTKTRRKQSDRPIQHCHTDLSQHSASKEFGTGSRSFHWKEKFQYFLLNKGFTTTPALQQPPYLQC